MRLASLLGILAGFAAAQDKPLAPMSDAITTMDRHIKMV